MNKNNLRHSRCHRRSRQRRGTATFEFLMSMPLLFSMIILITWMGFSVVGQSEVTVQARYDAWQKRFDDPPGTPLVFLQGDILEEAELVEKDIISGEAETSFEISPLVDDMDSPEARIQLMVGTWDHRQLPLDELPNYKTHGLMAASALLGGFQNLIVQAGNIWGNVENAASGVVGWQDELLDSLGEDIDKKKTEAEEHKEKKKKEISDEIDETDKRIIALEAELTEVNQRIKDLLLDSDQPQPNEEGEQPESESAELRILLAKRKRLNTDIDDARKHRNELQRQLNEL